MWLLVFVCAVDHLSKCLIASCPLIFGYRVCLFVSLSVLTCALVVNVSKQFKTAIDLWMTYELNELLNQWSEWCINKFITTKMNWYSFWLCDSKLPFWNKNSVTVTFNFPFLSFEKNLTERGENVSLDFCRLCFAAAQGICVFPVF